MVDYVKKKIVEKLARFTKNLKPSDISLSFLSGKGHLSNLELNAQFISEVLQLPPWVTVSRVVCDTIKARVPFTNLKTDPVNFYIGQVLIEITTASSQTKPAANKSSNRLFDKIGGKPSKYGLIEKVIDGMRVEVRSVLVFLRDPTFHAQLEMTDILLQSTSPDWQMVPLNRSRVYIEDEDSVINYKLCTWSSLKIEGWSTVSAETVTSHNQLRLIVNATTIHIAFKRKVGDSSLMCSRISLHLGDLIWILTQSQLRAVSRLVQSLMDAAIRTQQYKREDEEVGSEGGSAESAPGEGRDKSQSNRSLLKEKLIAERLMGYREGKKNLPVYEVMQNSFHLKTGKMDLQLCDDTSDVPGRGPTGSLLVQVFELVVDVYLDQPACSGRAHWNKANDVLDSNTRWSRKLVRVASKTQYVDLPSVHVTFLRERGVVIRCADFSVGALRNQEMRKQGLLPILTSDKKTFNIPDDVHNPAFQVGITLYSYANNGSSFLVPRPNVFLYVSPLHVNVHQATCLWLVEFLHGVIRTVNVELALNMKTEGKAFLEERKLQAPPIHRLPGLDLEVKILFTKVTLPVAEAADDGRPKALQIETAAIEASNCPLHHLLGDSDFEQALDVLRQGWLFTSQDTTHFPHYQDDLRALPLRLQKLLRQRGRLGRKRGESLLSDESSGSERSDDKVAIAPEKDEGEMALIEGWHIHTGCVQVAFVSHLTHKATLHTTPFVDDFPLHLWLFLPPSSLDAALYSTSTPITPQQSPSTPLSTKTTSSRDPRISFLAHVATPIRVRLDRLQLLFLLRLKDSLTAFKTTLMQFLDPDELSPNIKETLEAHRHANQEKSSEALSPPTTISGCVGVSCVEASIILPSLYTSRPNQATNTDTTKGARKEENDNTGKERGDISVVYDMVSNDNQPMKPSPLSLSQDSIGSSTAAEGQRLGNMPSGGQLSNSQNSVNSVNISASGSVYSQPPDTSSSQYGLQSHNQAAMIYGSSSPSPTGSLISLPVILETSPKTSNMSSNHTPPARSHSTTEIPRSNHTMFGYHGDSIRTTGLSSTLEQCSAEVKDEISVLGEGDDRSNISSEEEFLLVQAPSDYTLHPPLGRSHLLDQPLSKVSGGVHGAPPTNHTLSTSGTSRTSSPLSSLPSPIAKRRQKNAAPLRVMPKYVLQIQVHHVCALPNISSGKISARLSVDNVNIRELTSREYEGMLELMKKKKLPQVLPPGDVPSIKARLEVGLQVGRFYPPESDTMQDIVVLAQVEGLDLSLLLPNIPILKDFFDDEFETVKPLPLHVKVLDTRAVLMEDVDHTSDHPQSMVVSVDMLELHKGRQLAAGLDVFKDWHVRDDVMTTVPRSEEADGVDNDLLEKFSSIQVDLQEGLQYLPVHTRKLLHAHVLDLHSLLSATPTSISSSSAISFMTAKTHRSNSSSSETFHLRQEVERLRHIQRECEDLSAQLKESQVVMDKQMGDFLMVTDECKRVKEELVSYKQVMEKQQELIERLLTENFDLRRLNPTPPPD